MRNPYVCGGWVTGPQFYGRDSLIDDIFNGQHRLLYAMGGRRSGKTSLLRQVESMCIGQGRPCLFLDLQRSGRTWNGLVQTLRMELRDKAHRWEYLLVPRLFAIPDVFELLISLEERAQVQGCDLLLLVDEADVLLDLAGFSGEIQDRFWTVLTGGQAIRPVLSASPELARTDRFRDGTHSLGQQCRLRFLSSLGEDSAKALVQQSNSGSPLRVPRHLLEQITATTGCHPFLLQLLCQRLYQPGHSLRSITEADLAPDELLKTLFDANYQCLGATERQVLWLVAAHPGHGLSELVEQTDLDVRVLASCLAWLECLGYVCHDSSGEPDDEGVLQIANAFLRSWLQESHSSLADPTAGEYDLEQLARMAGDTWPHLIVAEGPA